MVIHPSITVAVVTHFISSPSSLLVMLLNLALLGDVLGGGTSVDVPCRNVVMVPAWSIVLATAAWEGVNDKEAEEANTDDKPTDAWRWQ
jgi:hypothetical protein